MSLQCYPQVFRADNFVMYDERNNVAALQWIFTDSEKAERDLSQKIWGPFGSNQKSEAEVWAY